MNEINYSTNHLVMRKEFDLSDVTQALINILEFLETKQVAQSSPNERCRPIRIDI